jgi:hypothetical protein
MSRKDYAAIAAVFRKHHEGFPLSAVSSALGRGIADVLEADNSRFDRDKFYQACGFSALI